MSFGVSFRVVAACASVVFACVAVAGCGPGLGGGSADSASLPNIPEGQKQQLVSELNAAGSAQDKALVAHKAVALSQMVGAQLVGVEPTLIASQKFQLGAKGQTVVNKDDMVYQMMSATDFWRLGDDTYDLCVEQDCEFYSSWTVDVEGSGGDVTYVWTLKIEGEDQPDKPLVRRFKVAK